VLLLLLFVVLALSTSIPSPFSGPAVVGSLVAMVFVQAFSSALLLLLVDMGRSLRRIRRSVQKD
jgi:hypothetical protein